MVEALANLNHLRGYLQSIIPIPLEHSSTPPHSYLRESQAASPRAQTQVNIPQNIDLLQATESQLYKNTSSSFFLIIENEEW
jgi:hypothetical protein